MTQKNVSIPSDMDQGMENGYLRVLIAISVMLSAIMVLLDMTIANVSLPHMMGALGVTSDQITWVLTSYSMAEAICIPLAGYLSLKFGIRRLLLISVSGFVLMSALCGQATSLTEMIIFRTLQGGFGAAVIPLSQSVMFKIFPSDQQGKAMAIFSIGILLGPILGPTVGGLITENMDWRWIFYVNVPVGLCCLTLLFVYVHIDERGKPSIDWPLIFGMAIGIGLLQMVLERGNQDEWFSSNTILFSSIIAFIAWVFFLVRSFRTKGEIAPMWLLKNKNLLVSCIMMSIFSMGMFGITQLKPMMLENLLNYPVETTGFMMAPRGIVAAIVLIGVAPFIDKIDPRKLIFIGLVLNGISAYLMTFYSINIDTYWVIMPSLIQGAGMGLVFAPLTQLACSTLSSQNTVGGTVVFNLFRTLGGSFGVSIVNTYFTRVQQDEWHALGEGITANSQALQNMAGSQNVLVSDPAFMSQISLLLQEQSTTLAYVSTFGFIMISYFAIVPFLFFLDRKRKSE